MKSRIFACTITSLLAISTSAFADYYHVHSVGGVQVGASFSTAGFQTGGWVTSTGNASEQYYAGSYYKSLATSEQTVTTKVLNYNSPIAYMGTYGEGMVWSPDNTGAQSYAQIGGSMSIMNNVVWNTGALYSYGSAASVTTQSSTSQSADSNYWGADFYNTNVFSSGWVPVYSIFIFEVDVLGEVGGSVYYSPAASASALTRCAGTVSTQGGVSCYNWAHTTNAYSNNYVTAALTARVAARVGVSVGIAGAHAYASATVDILRGTSTQTTNASNVNATSVYMGPHNWSWSGNAVDTLSTLSGEFHVGADITTIVGTIYSKDWKAFSWSGINFPAGNASMSGSEQI
jgi:hypothetical protein